MFLTGCRAFLVALAMASATGRVVQAQVTDSLSLRGQAQVLHLYGPCGGPPVVVSSGDGGWVHLGPHVARALAATDPQTRRAIAGVIGLGLPDVNELDWRWKDLLIYVTHGIPSEPTFNTTSLIARMAPAPLALIQSTQDEFVTRAEAQRIFDAAGRPKRQWFIEAADHRFSNSLAELDRRLLDEVAWVREHAPR